MVPVRCVAMMSENSIVCQCTFFCIVWLIVIVLVILDVWLVWCVPDRAFCGRDCK